MFDASLQVIDVKAGGGKEISIGEMVKQFLTRLDWFDTRWPRVPGFFIRLSKLIRYHALQ